MLARASDTKQPTSPKYAENPVAVDDALKTSLKSRKKTAEFQELNSILEFVDSVHEVTKVVGIAFHDPLQITEFTNIHQSGRGGLRLQDNRQTGQSTTQFNHHPLQSTISTSLTVAGSGFRTIAPIYTSLTAAGFTASGQSAAWSVNHPIQFNQPSNSINHPIQSTVLFDHPLPSSTSIITSLTVAGSGFRTIGRLVNQPSSINHLAQLPTSNPPFLQTPTSTNWLTIHLDKPSIQFNFNQSDRGGLRLQDNRNNCWPP
ncbi:hypothetical protein ACN42_g7142 [Penicillium freii]|uniref:Uncharacterized protein n=1 Tax=Penicillium freii TaxID=48697 RepID=A0A117NMZ1_PENFR|nr:hypothetical protein ACN42_g7142 [Penicillium freii]